MSSDCNIRGLSGLNDVFLPDKAKSVNSALKKMKVPFYQVCTSKQAMKDKDKSSLSWRRYSESCVPGAVNARFAKADDVDRYLINHYGISLKTFLKNPKKYESKKPIKEEKKHSKKDSKKEGKVCELTSENGEMKYKGYRFAFIGISRGHEYRIYKKQVGNAWRYYYQNKQLHLVAISMAETTKWLENWAKKAQEGKSIKTETAKPEKPVMDENKAPKPTQKQNNNATAMPPVVINTPKPVAVRTSKPKPVNYGQTSIVIPPPVVPEVNAKSIELKKFAKMKHFKSETKNEEFNAWALSNFEMLKKDYSVQRRFHKLPSGISDFQDYALYRFKNKDKDETKSLPPVEAKPLEQKKFASLKPYKNETKNEEFSQ